MLGELLDHMEGAQEVASEIAQEYPEYEAMAEEMRKATNTVAMACELKAYRKRESNGLMVVCPVSSSRSSSPRREVWARGKPLGDGRSTPTTPYRRWCLPRAHM